MNLSGIAAKVIAEEQIEVIDSLFFRAKHIAGSQYTGGYLKVPTHLSNYLEDKLDLSGIPCHIYEVNVSDNTSTMLVAGNYYFLNKYIEIFNEKPKSY